MARKATQVKFANTKEADIMRQIQVYFGVMPDIHFVRVSIAALPYQSKGEIRFRSNPMAGFPDLMGWILPDGRPFYIEAKSPKGKFSDKQKAWRQVLESMPNCIYIEARSLQDVIEGLEPYRDPKRRTA